MKELKNKRENLALTGLVFIVMPFISFIISIRNHAYPQFKIFILLFLILYGYTFIPIAGSDYTRYIEHFHNYSSYTFNDIKAIIAKTYTDESTNPDIYATFLLFLTTRVTNDYRVFFLIASLIYFSIALKLWETIWKLSEGSGFRFYTVFFIGTLFVVNFSTGINGIRWPLGFMVFSLGALKFILTNKKRYLITGFISVLIHFAFLFPSLFLLIFSILRLTKKTNVVMIILIGILFTASILSQLISSNAGIFGSGIQNRLTGFTGEGYLEGRSEHITQWNWYVQINLFATIYFLIFALILTHLRRSRLLFDDISAKLLIFVILLLTQSILSGNILDPMTNFRYYSIMSLFGLVTLNYLGKINQLSLLLRRLSYIYIPILILRALIILRIDLYTISPSLIFGNIFSIFFVKSDVSIFDFIFG